MIDMSPAAITVADLPIEPEALQAFALEQNRLAWVLWEQLESLQHQIAQLNRAHFGVSSERLAGQAELFDAASDLPVPPEPAKVQVEGHTRKGRPALSKDLPRTRVEYDPERRTEGRIRYARAHRRRAQRDAALRAVQAHRHRARSLQVRSEERWRFDHSDRQRPAVAAAEEQCEREPA